MARLYQGINGPFSGKVGPVVGYLWKGRACLRAYQSQIHYPNTEPQQKQRSWFVGMVRFASAATEALRLGLRQQAETRGMTEGNCFVTMNKQHFRREGDEVVVDYANLQISHGSAADVYFHTPRFDANEVVSVDFDKNMMFNHAAGSDMVFLYVYSPANDSGILSAPAERRSKRLSLRLPSEWAGSEVHLYGFVVDHAGRASKTTYIGVGRVNHDEDRSRYIVTDKKWQEFVELANDSNKPSLPSPTPVPENDAAIVAIKADPPGIP